MLNSMWSGVSGLQTHQVKMGVIGNDIANVNTIAFKQSNMTFKDKLYKTLKSPSAGSTGQQVGLGTAVGKVAIDFNGGTLQHTGKSSNMAITGNGFFVLKDADGTNAAYTRAGDFEFDYDSANNQLNFIGPDGKYLYGTTGGTVGSASTMIALPSSIQDVTISPDGVVSYKNSEGVVVEDVYTIDLATFASNEDLVRNGDNLYSASINSGDPQFGVSGSNIQQYHLENSNVDLAEEFTEMILTERGFQANSKMITTSDSMLQELLNLKR